MSKVQKDLPLIRANIKFIGFFFYQNGTERIRMGTKNTIVGYMESVEKWVEGKLNKAFQIFAAPSVLSTSKKSSDMTKNEEKPCSTCH